MNLSTNRFSTKTRDKPVVSINTCNLPTPCVNGAPPSAGMECCNGVEVPIGQCNPTPCENGNGASPGMECCGTVEFNPQTQVCCEGVPVPIGDCNPVPCANGNGASPGMECCNGQEYDPITHACCDDGSVALHGQCPPPPPPQPCINAPPDPGMECCGSQQYDPQYEECCWDGSVALQGQCPEPPPCVNGNGPLSPGMECCNGVEVVIGDCVPCRALPPPEGMECCSNGELYDPETQECCEEPPPDPEGQPTVRVVPKGECGPKVTFEETAPRSGFDDTVKPPWLVVPKGRNNDQRNGPQISDQWLS